MPFVNVKLCETLKRIKTEYFMGKRFLDQVIDILKFSLQFKD